MYRLQISRTRDYDTYDDEAALELELSYSIYMKRAHCGRCFRIVADGKKSYFWVLLCERLCLKKGYDSELWYWEDGLYIL